ncbi:probable palmitoyltransferase ZDHHC24 [Bombus affinis]|uniref:probable palmitoyltransferase ZDHHC24 n=1 Tax=Bombus affinis TaxID=309941 RepID=UPI0021B83752|nr:probable palmitoyltransferase ZDHHC24 [Bombus affinis]XP_050580629.1 probable palmitoyltransferase ZDHHC24 [Bombus affinis]XP_050580631.1 probable palmitoyltransferase ZDHHC24 [Bombus affinis]
MIIRKRIWPRTLSDFFSMTFILTIIPIIYWFQLWVVLPAIHEHGSLPYILHFLFGNFIMLNIVGNFTYIIFCDTSTRRDIMPISAANTKNGWRLCASCETLAPPRSWHCPTCNICILKRDHHCIFTGCCIGHYNHRYFIMFLLYLFVATTYSFCYNNLFIWNRMHFEFPMSLIKIIFPLAIFIFGFDGSTNQFYLILYIVSAVGMLYTGILCIYHFCLVLNGNIANESNKKIHIYNLGWKQNVKEVLGNRWYLTWTLPYIKSQLPHNGVIWDTSNSWQYTDFKNK